MPWEMRTFAQVALPSIALQQVSCHRPDSPVLGALAAEALRNRLPTNGSSFWDLEWHPHRLTNPFFLILFSSSPFLVSHAQIEIWGCVQIPLVPLVFP